MIEHFLALGCLFEVDQVGPGSITSQFTSIENRRSFHDMMKAGELLPAEVDFLIQKIQVWSIHLCFHMANNFLVNLESQHTIAYLILALARKKAGVLNYDSNNLRLLCGVEASESKRFKNLIHELSEAVQDISSTFKFDLVFREYTKEGIEKLNTKTTLSLSLKEQKNSSRRAKRLQNRAEKSFQKILLAKSISKEKIDKDIELFKVRSLDNTLDAGSLPPKNKSKFIIVIDHRFEHRCKEVDEQNQQKGWLSFGIYYSSSYPNIH